MAIELASLLLAIAPVFALGYLFYRADHARPEPGGLLLRTVVLGSLSCVPAAALELGARYLLGRHTHALGGVLDAYVVAALPEEGVKFAVVALTIYRKPVFDEVMDGVMYTVAASLGFCLLENVLFLRGGNFVVGVVRALSAVPMHAIASGLMGYFIGRARFADHAQDDGLVDALPALVPHRVPRPLAWCLTGLGAAVLVHGTYNWAVFASGARPIIFVEIPAILAVAGFALHRLVRHALALDEEMLGRGHRHSLIIVLAPGAKAPAPASERKVL